MAFKKSRLEAPEEGKEGKRPGRKGKDKEWSGGGFREGSHGIGSTPYMKSHSAAPASLKSHDATSGRGGGGVIGKADDFKGHAKDLEHPDSHEAFERLGVAEE
jgi:hypothetical protein